MSSDSASSRPKYPRPSVVTLSCVFVAVTAFLTLTELVSALMDWATVDMQAWLRPVLRQLAEAGAVLTMPEVLEYLRWAFLVMVPFAVAAMVFAIYALRGDRTARVMTTVLAVFAGIVSLPIGIFGVIQAAMLFAAASALWTSDARRWYRGEPPPEAPASAVAALSPPDAPQLPGAEVAEVEATPLPAQRPASVMVAGLVTIFGALIAGGFAGLYLLVTTFARDTYLDAFESSIFRDMMTAQELERSMQLSFWVSTAILPLALIGLVAGSALLSRRPGARSLTLWWAWVTVAVGVLALPLIILGVAVIVLLRRDDARQWTASR